MSSYKAQARKIDGEYKENEWEEVEMLDDYFGRHRYGVVFPDGEIYFVENCIIKK